MSDPQRPLRGVVVTATALIFAGLLVALGVGIAPNASTRLVQLGESIWPGYAAELRVEPEAPECDLDSLRERLQQCPEGAGAPAPPGGDPFGGDDPFAEPEPDPFGGDDPFANPAPDPFGGDDPFADAPATQEVNCPALVKAEQRCAARTDEHRATLERFTPGIRRFRGVDLFVGSLAKFPWWRHLLSLMLLAGAAATTASRMHIALRNPRTRSEHRLSQASQLVAHLLLCQSAVANWLVQEGSSAESENAALPVIWTVGFVLLAGINAWNLARPPQARDELTTVGRMLMVVPLYVWMVAIAGLYFLLAEQHWSGQAIYLHKFVQHPTVYIGIGLYIWAGMLLSATHIARLVFGVVTPWGLPPALLAWVVVVLAAVPTAYSGASGIFVIAAGAVIYHNMRAAGAEKRLALATTAMSGSLGVVLRPCLVVVLIAVLNKQVTTDQLFGNGLLVFALTAVLFLVAMLLYDAIRPHADGRGPIRTAAPFAAVAVVALVLVVFAFRSEGGASTLPYALPVLLLPLVFVDRASFVDALPASVRAALPLLPYLAVGGLVLLAYQLLFATGLNERTAPYVLPVMLLPLVVLDRWRKPQVEAPTASLEEEPLGQTLLDVTSESSMHIGALLMVMAGSVGLGGVVERSDLMSLVPADLGSTFTTMALLVIVLVLVGMTMDALGAVVLVTVSVAQVAYANGIDPVHFWMTVLVAFELGYLTPPVALNHLLARQVIGPEAEVEGDGTQGFWARYEHLWLPMAVMGTALVLVAFVPLLFYTA